MDLQQLYSKVRQALDRYNMVNEGDKIAIGISGGKDSLGLLYAMAGLSKFYPKKYRIVAITVDLGYEGFDTTCVERMCRELDVEYCVVNTNINEMIAKEGCSLCARLRKGALHDKARELGCNKIAYAHNMDDVIETMMLSLIYEGRFSTFYPVTYYENIGMELIRPYVLVTNAQAKGFVKKYNLSVINNPCPFEKISERDYVRKLIEDINSHTPGVRKRLMTAICDGTLKEWSVDNQ